MKLTKIQITNYRGVSALSVDVPPSGLIAKGGNSKGKSTILKAVRSVLEARDISADAIRNGSDRAEILVDLDNVSVKRAITAKTSTLTVERDGMKASKPTAYLRELLGSASLDPLEIYKAKPKERRGLILAALPCKVTVDELRKYIGDLELPLDFDATGHALEVIEKARAFFYSERTIANREAEDARRTTDRLANEATQAATAVTPGPIVDAEQAKIALAQAERELAALEGRAQEAEDAARRTAGQRERIETLRAQAKDVEAGAPARVETAQLESYVANATKAVQELRQRLADAEDALHTHETALAAAHQANAAIAAAVVRSTDLYTQAETLASALAAATLTAPSAGEILAAQAKIDTARAALDRAAMQARAMAAVEAAEAAKKTAATLQEEADGLDEAVKRLANDAPRELLASTDSIPGLGLDGDDVTLDGVRLDERSDSEQIRFAVEIARRANDKTKILVVDGLERLDTEQLEIFVNHATRDGWQMIGSLVTGGELVVAAIEPSIISAAAE